LLGGRNYGEFCAGVEGFRNPGLRIETWGTRGRDDGGIFREGGDGAGDGCGL